MGLKPGCLEVFSNPSAKADGNKKKILNRKINGVQNEIRLHNSLLSYFEFGRNGKVVG
jgi:hypothetical protein